MDIVYETLNKLNEAVNDELHPLYSEQELPTADAKQSKALRANPILVLYGKVLG